MFLCSVCKRFGKDPGYFPFSSFFPFEKKQILTVTYLRCPFCLSVFGKYTTDTSWAHLCFKGRAVRDPRRKETFLRAPGSILLTMFQKYNPTSYSQIHNAMD